MRISEMPYLHNDELPLGVELNISNDALERSYILLGSIRSGAIEVYEKSDSSGFIAGIKTSNGLATFVDIKTRRKAYPVEPKNLHNYHQVSMVIVGQDHAERGITREIYEFLAGRFDLVSDHEQYQVAKKLWQSLAKSKKINVYVWSGDNWLLDGDNPKKYDGTNINSAEIWGRTIEYKTRLIVATKRDL